ncbi:MAG: hypothetical protein JWN70_3413 [Planctomycetaceae bacterium]|nr:hypothetical protein [Planctomycetaceae bacterium]
MSSFFEKLETTVTQSEASHRTEWIELVEAVARQRNDLDPEETLAKLDRIGKTIAQLKAAAETYLDRRRILKAIDELSRESVPLSQLSAEQDELVRLKDEYLKAFHQSYDALAVQINQVRKRRRQVRENRATLLESSHPDLIAAVRTSEASLAELRRRKVGAENDITSSEGSISKIRNDLTSLARIPLGSERGDDRLGPDDASKAISDYNISIENSKAEISSLEEQIVAAEKLHDEHMKRATEAGAFL